MSKAIESDSDCNVVDFFGASHGHFLEYVINGWIYQTPRVAQVFNSLGASHLPKASSEYQLNRQIVCGHFTEGSLSLPRDPEKIVRITVTSTMGSWIHLVNAMHRACDVPLTENYKQIPEKTIQSPHLLRGDWFSKLIDQEPIWKTPQCWSWPDMTGFEFPMESLYDICDFYRTLTGCAKYLDQRFIPDHELLAVWHAFIELNQGLQSYQKANQIVEFALKQKNHTFESTVFEQAMINVMLTEIVEIYDGRLFVDDDYPTNTLDIWHEIKTHLVEFDRRFAS